MTCVSRSPTYVHVRPASVDLKTPAPGETELREFGSPVPAYRMLVSEGAIAISLTACTPVRSKTGSHVVPALIERHKPPVAKETKMTLGFCGLASMSTTRPVMLAGPIERHRNAARKAESACIRWAWAGAEARSARARTVIARRMVGPRAETCVDQGDTAGPRAAANISIRRSGPGR